MVGRIRFWIGLALSALFLYLSFRKVDLGALLTAFRGASYWWAAPVVALTFGSIWVRAVRWKVLLSPLGHVRTDRLLSATLVGLMANNLLPAHMGELLRAEVISRREGISWGGALGSIVVERTLDGLVVMATFLGVVPFVGAPGWVRTAGAAGLGLFVCALVALIALRGHVEALIGRLSGRLGRFVEAFSEGLGALAGGGKIRKVLLLSFGVWTVAMAALYGSFLAFHRSLPLYSLPVVMGLMTIGVMIPSSPGYVGTLQYSCILGLSLFGVPKEEALGISAFYHATQYLPVTGVGWVLYARTLKADRASIEGR